MITTVCKISYGSQTVPPIVPAVQGDTGRAISFEIADFTPPAGATATYFILKPSGEAIYNSATITDNSILCELTAQSLAEAGENRMQVRVLQGENIVTSFEVILMVRTFLGDDAIESGTEMNIFDQAVEQATEQFQENAEQIVAEVIESIPADYTELTEEVDELNERFDATTLSVPYTHERLIDYSEWFFGQYLYADTGLVRPNRPDGCRTNYVPLLAPTRIILNNSDYVFIVWTYATASTSSAVYSPTKEYKNAQVTIIPKDGATRFMVSVMRADGANLTTDYTDTTSDAYKIINSLKAYQIGTNDLNMDGVPVYTDAVRDAMSRSIQKEIINIFNLSSEITSGKMYYSDGVLHNVSGSSTTDYISVDGMTEIMAFPIRNIAWFDSQKVFKGITTTSNKDRQSPQKYPVPSDAVYMRIGAFDSDIPALQVGKEVARNNYIPHSDDVFSIPGLRIYHNQIITNDWDNYNAWFVTPEYYGAVGDGVSDDTNAFAQALNDGRPIQLGWKTYKTNIEITGRNTRIFGMGTQSVLVPADTSKPVIKVNVDTAESTTDIIDQIILQDFKIYGESSAVVGISLRCCQFCILERLTIERCYTEGIRFRGVFDSKITDCDIITCGNTGFTGEDDGLGNYAVTIDKATGMNTNAIVFKGLHIEQTPRMLKMQNTQQLMFTDCKFETHSKPYDSDPTVSPIKGIGSVKGVIFTNCVLTYSALLSDTSEPVLFNSGNPLIVMDLTDATDADEKYVLFSACQFRTQNNRAGVYFDVNHTNFIGCTFNRCDGSTTGNKLGKYSSLTDCNMVMINGVRALQLAGTQVLVSNTRINIGTDVSGTSIINVDSTADRGKASVLYNGNDRSNLADGTINIPVEFIGVRTYAPS